LHWLAKQRQQPAPLLQPKPGFAEMASRSLEPDIVASHIDNGAVPDMFNRAGPFLMFDGQFA
jgi:hypothetical protein